MVGESRVQASGAGAIRVLSGPRAAEAALFAELDAAVAARDALTLPLRIVVPSRSLRDHLSRSYLRHRGVSTLGLAIQSHFALALEALERLGEAPRPGQALSRLLTRRAVRSAAQLRRDLVRFQSGWEGAWGSLRDLLDAGFRPPHLAAALDCVAAGEAGARRERVADLLRVAARLVDDLEGQDSADPALLLERATAALWSRGPALIPSAGLWVYGVADATGALADWIDALLTQLDGRILVNQPPDPADRARAESRYSGEFLDRLVARRPNPAARFGHTGNGGNAPGGAEGSPAPRVRLLCAVAPAAEVEEIAARVRALLDRGVEPEDIGVCARRFDAYRSSLVEALERWAIPFSAIGLGTGGGPVARCGRALAQLLERGPALDIDAWADLDPLLGADERTGFHHLGLSTLQSLCETDSDAGFAGSTGLPLPVRRRADRARVLDRAPFERARERARGVLRALAAWPPSGAASGYAALLRELLDALGWSRAGGAYAAAAALVDTTASSLPENVPVEAEEWISWLGEAVTRERGPEPGGRGAGVQVLSVVAARERCFAHLFLLGLGRDVFPRPISDDPLFPESSRARLRAVLPDLPLKRRGYDEERHLFASLLECADEVTLTRSACTATGREWPESPLLLRLRLARPELSSASPLTFPQDGAGPLRTPLADIAAARAAQRGDEKELTALLPEAVAARQREAAILRDGPGFGIPPHRIAQALRAAWRELDPALGEASRAPLGPFFGWVGAPAPAAPERGSGAEPYITAIADLLRCPWQRFLRRELRLAPPPDAGVALPSPTPRLIGGTLHQLLERVVEESYRQQRGDTPRTLADRTGAGPVPLRWPDSQTLERWVAEEAEAAARREGIRAPFFPQLLARSLAPAVACARALDEARPPAVLGAELDGVAHVADAAGTPRRLRFRADRVDAGEDGLVFVEYKSGRCFLDRVRETSRVRALGEVLRHGQGIQTPSYLYAADAVASRLVFLGRGTASARRETTLRRSDEAVLASFEQSAAIAFRALDRGLRPPRLLGPKGEGEGAACHFCEMRAACLQGDSGHLARLRERGVASPPDADRDLVELLAHGAEAAP